jgi:hypothetical protein
MKSRLGDNLLAIYSDALALKNGTGIRVGFVAYDYAQDAQEVFTLIFNIGENQIVYNGELKGLALAMEYAARVATPLQEVWVHADNQTAIYCLCSPLTDLRKPGNSAASRLARKSSPKVQQSPIFWFQDMKTLPETNEQMLLQRKQQCWISHTLKSPALQ